MLNSKSFFILVINIGLLALSTILFVHREKTPTLKETALTITESNRQPTSTAADASLVSEEPAQFTPRAPVPLVIEKKENVETTQRRLRERQASTKENRLLVEKLTLLLKQNEQLAEQISDLRSAAETQDDYIAQLEKNNRERSLHKRNTPSLIASESDLLKTNIQRQPDLIKQKSPIKIIPQTDDIELPEVAEGEPLDKFSGAVEFGFSYEQDNKVARSIDGRLVLNYEEPNKYKLNSNFMFELEEEDRQMSTEKYRWQLQGDHYLNLRNLIFARSDLKRSQFASYEQEDVYTVGYGRIIFDLNKHKFNVEIGPGYRMAVPNVGEDAVSVDEFIVRTRLHYERIVSESLQIAMDTVWIMGNENSIYSVNFKAQNKIYRELYLIFDSEYQYTQNVPVDSLHKEVSSGLKLMYAF
ncbi:DUF481 domain-containing protein [Psychromonas antarctica]|uniref:DUF481 domain-containing protein n=1 Tax=Psychromonas antarctica TaxID=67573 RepID=UPI001EE9851F|nr:DUF481 domain-containing protein [Psychromonas antarctica]MCG6200021.1 DUF481 domain-containing protein [Psychromonas antarctica]